MMEMHALPDGWPELDYFDFLERRRKLIAHVIRRAYERLQRGEHDPTEVSWPPSNAAVEAVLAGGETSRVEMKASLRADTAGKGIPPKVLEKVVARTVAGFLNHHGGLLVIGADDAGVPVGLERDFATLSRKDLDGFQQALVQILATYLGSDVAASVRIHLAKIGADGRDLALLECKPHSRPVFLTDGGAKEFHVRAGNTTRKLDIEETSSYIASHWGVQPAWSSPAQDSHSYV
jgi:hypothetical protein